MPQRLPNGTWLRGIETDLVGISANLPQQYVELRGSSAVTGQDRPRFPDDARQFCAFSTFHLSPPSLARAEVKYVAIARELSGAEDVWACQWRDYGLGLSVFGIGIPCLRVYPTLGDVCEHWTRDHGAFHEAERPFRWVCKDCGFDDESPGPCPRCISGRCSKRWWAGFVSSNRTA